MSRRSVGVTPGGTAPAGGGGLAARPVRWAAPGGTGFSGTGVIGVGTGEVAGGVGRFTGCAPGTDATGDCGTPPGVTPGVVGIT